MVGGRRWALVAAVALAASVTSLRNGFVYDDVPVVRDDPRIHHLSAGLLTMSYWGGDVRDRIYRPFTTASLALDWAAGGGRPFTFHLTNVLLHVAVCLLVFALARRLLGAGAGALVAALWFAVQPVHVEAVANVVGRAELLAAAGYLAAVVAYLADGDASAHEARGGRRAWLALVVLAAAGLAYGSKEHALTLPAALLLADAWAARGRGEPMVAAFRRHAVLWTGTVAVGVGYLAARAHAVGTAFGGGSVAAGLEHLNAAARLIVMVPATLVWERLLLWPVHLSADYSPDAFVPRSSLGATHALAVAALLGIGAAAWAMRRRAPGVLAGLAWFVVTASVAANVLVPTGVMIAERVLYLPSVGAAVAAGALWTLLRGRWVWPATAVAVTLLAARSLARIPVWHDGDRFYAALVHDAPASYRTHWASGARAFDEGRPREGERQYRLAIRTWPDDPAVPQELGERYLAAGLFAPADRFLTVAFRLDPTRADAAVQAALARLRLDRPDSALALAREALRRYPTAPTLLMAASDAELAMGRPVPALTFRRRIVYAWPHAWQYEHIAADGAARAGLCDEARRRAERAVALAPDSATAPRLLLGLLSSGPRCGLPS